MSNVKSPIDWQELLTLTNNNPELAKELLGMFANELPTMRDAINAAHQKQDYTLLQELIHKLHGSCCYTGVTQLKALAAELEDTLKLQQHGAIGGLMKRLNHEVNTVLTTIQNQHYLHE